MREGRYLQLVSRGEASRDAGRDIPPQDLEGHGAACLSVSSLETRIDDAYTKAMGRNEREPSTPPRGSETIRRGRWFPTCTETAGHTRVPVLMRPLTALYRVVHMRAGQACIQQGQKQHRFIGESLGRRSGAGQTAGESTHHPSIEVSRLALDLTAFGKPPGRAMRLFGGGLTLRPLDVAPAVPVWQHFTGPLQKLPAGTFVLSGSQGNSETRQEKGGLFPRRTRFKRLGLHDGKEPRVVSGKTGRRRSAGAYSCRSDIHDRIE